MMAQFFSQLAEAEKALGTAMQKLSTNKEYLLPVRCVIF
jgi:hypothetical protein